jgi:sigma-B regulation protein RsbU (phosphoserine phosphatase)
MPSTPLASFAAVSTLRLFEGVDAGRLERELADCEERACAEGATLLRPGESNDSIYLVLEGELLVKIGEGDFAIGPGECFGEMSVVDGRKVSALVVAGKPTRLLVVPGRVFWERLMTIPNLARNVFSMLVQRLRNANAGLLAEQRQRILYERLQQEMAAAREIQSSMMPSRLKLFPGRGEIDCAGAMFPAVDVAGDFFDACMLSDTEMFFAVGDVSGKGVSAALFMAKTVPLLRLEATRQRRIAAILASVNDSLCENNPRCMFVTLGCGILDLANGLLRYGNAGHLPPALLGTDGATRFLPVPTGLALGALPGETYEEHRMTVRQGELLLLCSDGVTEAFNPKQEAFGQERLLEALGGGVRPATEIVSGMKRAVDVFTAGATQSDDIALFAVRYLGAGAKAP